MDEKTPERVTPPLEWEARETGQRRPPEEFENPAGVGGETCETQEVDADPEPCDPTEIEDQVMEESMPGVGIEGYEGEEVGGA